MGIEIQNFNKYNPFFVMSGTPWKILTQILTTYLIRRKQVSS
jgi:hypothetical protein